MALPISYSLAAALVSSIQFIVFLFAVVATPLEQFKAKASSSKVCVTLWGIKEKCSSSAYAARGLDAWGCSRRKHNMVSAEVFSILSIAFTLAVFVLCLLMLFGIFAAKKWRAIPAFTSIVAVYTLLVTWACVAGVYNEEFCKGPYRYKYSRYYHYGAGFGLFVTAWCLQIINCILLLAITFL